MANEYISLDELKDFIGRTSTDRDSVLNNLRTVASRWVDSKCGRRFHADTVATARVFQPLTYTLVSIDDALEITAVATDEADTGSYATTWAATDYQTLPLNGVGQNGATGWPATMLEAIEARWFPRHRRPSVRVTAKWGWAAVPADVKQATLYYAHRLFYLIDTPGGTTMSTEFGAQPIRSVRDIEQMLAPFMRANAGDGKFLVG